MTYESYMAESEYLQHHGVLGMKWGVRRYQPYPDNYRGDGKFLGKRERQLSKTQDRIERSVAKARKAAEKGDVKALNKYNKRTERLTKKEQKQIGKYNKALSTYNQNREIVEREKEAEKQKFLATASAADIYENKNKYEFTKEDLDKATNRILSETKIESIMQSDKRAKMDATSAKIHSMVVLGQNAVDAFNTYERVADVVNKVAGKSIFPEPTKKMLKKESAEKNAIMRSVDLDFIMKNKDKLTPDEFTKALQSIKQLEQAKLSTITTEKQKYSLRKDAYEWEKDSAKMYEDKAAKAKESRDALKDSLDSATTKVKEATDAASAPAKALESAQKKVNDLSKKSSDATLKWKIGDIFKNDREKEEAIKTLARVDAELSIAKEKLETTKGDDEKAKTAIKEAQTALDTVKKTYDELDTVAKEADTKYEEILKRMEKIRHSDIPDDYLEHHGIKGQHWGVKNGPPYPLGKKTHNRIVKGKNERARVTAEEYRKLRKKKGQKKEGITHLAAPNERFWQEVVSASNLPRPMQVAEMLKSGEHDYLKRLDRPGHRVTEADMKDVNYSRRHNENEYGNNMNDPGLSNNCAKCSASLFLRSLGYDVQAGRSAHGALTSAGQYWFDGAVPYKEKSISNLQRRLESFGNKGKGMLGCRRADGSGHSIYFQNEKGEDGKYHPVIYDGQIARRYTSLADLFEAESFDETQFSTITRLDNATPNWDHLAEDSVSRMNYSNDNLNSVRNTKDGRQYLANNFRYT